MLAPYRTLFDSPAISRFVVAGLCARLGAAMLGVSTIVMIAMTRDSYGLAGAVSGVGLVMMAIGGPTIARLIDRHGQSAVGLRAVVVTVVCAVALVIACRTGAPTWTLFAAVLGNGVQPNVGTLSRARWAHLLRDDPARLHTANSFEQVAEELCFAAGPAVGAALAATVAPEAGFVLASALYAVGSVALLLQRGTEPPVTPAGEHHTGAAVRAPGLLLLTAGLALTGAVFGSIDVSVIAFAEERGAAAWGGLTLAMFATGSAVGGLVYGSRPHAGALAPQLLWFELAMVALLAPVLLIESVPVLGAAGLVAGLAIAPTLIIATMLSQRLVPASQLNEGMTVALTGLLLGVSAGSFVAGQVIEAAGAHRAFLVPVGSAALAAVIALVGRGRLVAAEQRARRLWGTPG